ncbi:E3 ubiquitin-protein ligase RNF183 [Cololabis saira]|uniref:E3 ubiquitin-protein ligase RNF183 n=1 Tax=Cololabis saira TaxID=129043 RepID=UPI002AD26AA3|nr:E3 ubiquitin-protein ligase RNF183 [Cololabis saira]XP_061573366.1 E3 ubiquitin-protein ligase RNF183 [Cololabis saira]
MSGAREPGPGPPPAPNVKPKPGQSRTGRSSKEDRRREGKPAKARRSRSTEAERGRGRGRDPAAARSRRGRSEEARRRDRRGEGSPRRKPPPDGGGEDDGVETECAVCFSSYDNVFKTPKLLACGHTFCLECLARINVGSAQLTALSCPLCREPTRLAHGRDLPRLGTNQDIITRLPAAMRRACSVRFKRGQGKLVLKNPPPRSPVKSPAAPGDPGATVVDVGRPPSRMRGRLRRLFRSDRCYYAVVAAVITVTVVILLVGILAFAVVPATHHRPVGPENHTLPGPGP